jgi:Leucine-rich repeat (LRR) protein
MKNLKVILFMFVFLVLSTAGIINGLEVSTTTKVTVKVVFNDPNLEQAVRTALGIPAPTPITDTDMATLTAFYPNNKGISDLTGMEYAVNLFFFQVGLNQISDLTSLQSLVNLRELRLNNNQISDITPLQNLTNLSDLRLNSNQIVDLTPLQNLTNLTILSIGTNQISDISILQNFTNLQKLYMERNQISDITSLQNLTELFVLNAGMNQIVDISALQNLMKINDLTLYNNQINDLTPLQNLTNMLSLYLNTNQIIDISPLENMTLLVNLSLGYNQVADITILQNMPNMQKLYLERNQISDIAALHDMTEMLVLNLPFNQLDNSDLPHLYDMDKLTTLDLRGNVGITSGSAMLALADNLDNLTCEQIKWDGVCEPDLNTAPVAVINSLSPNPAEVGATVTVQASATDNEDDNVQMMIDWGNGYVSSYTGFQASGSGFEFTYTYPSAGSFEIKVRAKDIQGWEGDWSLPATVTINCPVPVITVPDMPISLWPPNHKNVTIEVAQCVVSVTSVCGDVSVDDIVVTRVTSDEEEDAQGNGDGATNADILIAENCTSVELRKERAGTGNGRVYTIYLAVDDEAGNIGTATLEVQVPHHPGDPVVNDGVKYEVFCGVGVGEKSQNEIAETQQFLPEQYTLLQNYPNPFNPVTEITYMLPKPAAVNLTIYNSAGQLVRTLADGQQPAGVHRAIWDATDTNGMRVANGIYLAVLKANNWVAGRKLALMK